MYNKNMKKYEILRNVEKPTRYLGNEINSVHKSEAQYDIHFLFAFPDLYEVGMSHLGMHILYRLLNAQEGVFCERIFAVPADMEQLILEEKTSLSSLESGTPLKDFDFVGFTLQYEMSYTNVLHMLKLGGIPLRAEERTEEHPLIIAGGPTAFNPEPMAAFFDLYLIGEAEETLLELLEVYKTRQSKEDFLRKASAIRGIYVPKLYREQRGEQGELLGYEKTYECAQYPVIKTFIKDMSKVFYPDAQIIPFMDTVHDRGVMEVFRGCTQGCRFCQAGMIYRPVRERPKEAILKHVDDLIKNGGYHEFSLASLSTLDYSEIESLVDELNDKYEKEHISISLPSLRLDSFSTKVLSKVASVRKSGITFAPEAGTQRLRDVINKNVSEQDITSTMREIFALGWQKIKLYFILGLPTESFQDVQGIEKVAKDIEKIYQEVPRSRSLLLTVSTSSLVPKPFTPFQWVRQESAEVLRIRQDYLKKHLRGRSLQYNYHDVDTTTVEGILARGGRETADVIERAYERGARFDSWKEYFNFDTWMQALADCGQTLEQHLRARELDEFLPWEIIDAGVDKQFLIKEYEKALEEKTTMDCRDGCLGCGINTQRVGGICFER